MVVPLIAVGIITAIPLIVGVAAQIYQGQQAQLQAERGLELTEEALAAQKEAQRLQLIVAIAGLFLAVISLFAVFRRSSTT